MNAEARTADPGARISQRRTPRLGGLPSKSGQRTNAGGVVRPEILIIELRAGAPAPTMWLVRRNQVKTSTRG
jgi:hypothetical protein